MKRIHRLGLGLGSVVLCSGLASCHATSPPSVPVAAHEAGAPTGSAAPAIGFAMVEAPLSLTASDGTGLRLAALAAEAVVDGPLAFTELHLTFDNPADRTIEGRFRITLPQGASLGRFAMKIEGAWQEGEVVELAAARRAYEDFLHRKQDPALMEKAAGNEFSARVFPIPARGTKELVVSWVEELHGGRYRLPLKGLPELGNLDVKVRQAGAKPGAVPFAQFTTHDTAPRADYVADLRSSGADSDMASVRNGELAIVRVRPQAQPKPDPLSSAIVLVDTSASRALGFESEIDLVGRIVARIGEGKGKVSVACFDQSVAPIFDGAATDLRPEHLAKIRQRGALGASDLERALGWAHDAAQRSGAKRVVLVTDGVATAGSADAKKLTAKVAALKEVGVERLDAVAIGGIRDDVALARLVRGNLVRDGIVANTTTDASDVVRRLGEATRSGIAVRVEGATWSWPRAIDGAQAGDTYSVYAEVPKGKEVKVSIDGVVVPIVLRGAERPIVERAVEQAKISSMLDREATADPQTRESLKKSIVSAATRHRIMTPYTAMLVLESQNDYVMYGIDRKSLADVLAIEDGAVKRVHRTSLSAPVVAPVDDTASRDEEEERDVLKKAQSEAIVSDKGLDEAPRGPRPSERARPRSAPSQPVMAKAAGPAATATFSTATRPPPAPAQAARAIPRAPRLEPPPPASSAAGAAAPVMRQRVMVDRLEVAESADGVSDGGPSPYEGRLADVMERLATKRVGEALNAARAWRAEAPGDVLALVALGEVGEASGDLELAARAYGSVLDLFSNRADLRRFAGERLERVGTKDRAALDLAIDSFEKALADRPDHPASHRLLTFALLRRGSYARAFETALAASRHGFEVDRFAGVDRILHEDIGLVGAAWAHAEPTRRDEIRRRVREAGAVFDEQPSIRFVLNWETDANDVDFHIHDARGGHAYYAEPRLPSGGELYADVTTGYGPECFTVRGSKGKRAAPYKLAAHYYSRGPMGYGMGKLEIIEHDGLGGLVFEERPFIVMVDGAFVDLGTVR